MKDDIQPMLLKMPRDEHAALKRAAAQAHIPMSIYIRQAVKEKADRDQERTTER
jgi:hypothetical protein